MSSGEAALAKIKVEPPDLVILDIKLTDRDGLDVLQEIRKDNPDLPVLLHSAYSTYKHNFHSWLANDYLVKSANLSGLKSKIKELLNI